jgi:hypothetical protein
MGTKSGWTQSLCAVAHLQYFFLHDRLRRPTTVQSVNIDSERFVLHCNRFHGEQLP